MIGALLPGFWEDDLESATWVVTYVAMESRREHRAPLSSAALEVLKRADGLRGRRRGLVFNEENLTRTDIEAA